MLNTAYSSKNLSFPIAVLTRWLMFDSEDETVQFCQLCGLTVQNVGPQGVRFLKGSLHNGLPKVSSQNVDKISLYISWMIHFQKE